MPYPHLASSHLTTPNTHPQELTSNLPNLPEIRQLVNNTLTPPLEALGFITRQAGQVAIAATTNINQGALTGLAGILQQLVTLLNQGQLQVRVGGPDAVASNTVVVIWLDWAQFSGRPQCCVLQHL